MSPKKKASMIVEPAPEATIDYIRSVYGDIHDATDNAMLAAHARHLHKAGVIDEHMVDEFTKPYYKLNVHGVQYTSAYLALHPDYTGQDADTIPTLQTATKRQRDDDEAERKILEDYRAGRINVWGNSIGEIIASGGRASNRTIRVVSDAMGCREPTRGTAHLLGVKKTIATLRKQMTDHPRTR